MSINISPGFASNMTSRLVSDLGPFFIDIYTGTPPASADLSPVGTLLGTVSVNAIPGAALHFSANANTVSKPSGEPWIVNPVATGNAGWFRLRAQADAGTSTSLSAYRIDGTIGTSSAPGDMIWDTLSMVTGQAFTIDEFVYSITPV